MMLQNFTKMCRYFLILVKIRQEPAFECCLLHASFFFGLLFNPEVWAVCSSETSRRYYTTQDRLLNEPTAYTSFCAYLDNISLNIYRGHKCFELAL
jgi:hypothetical protein